MPKTTVADADIESFTTIGKLLDAIPLDEDMLDHEPAIEKTGDHAARVDEEERNVRVKGWIYAYKMESDNDFHLIVGDAPNDPSPIYMNCEVSGLPAKKAPDFAALQKVREDFLAMITDTPSASKYKDLGNSPIHVEIEGSLFYDIDHRPGVVGPVKYRPHLPSAWEIHPISSIKKLSPN